MRVGRGDAERLRVSRPPPHPSGLRPATFPPVGGRLGVRSNREEFGLLWDVWIHILGIGAECACWKAGGPVCRPYGVSGSRPSICRGRTLAGPCSGRPQGSPLQEAKTCPLIRPLSGAPSPQGEGLYRRVRTPAPAGIVGEKRRAHNVRPYTAFTNGSIYKKRDRSGTCPLKPRGEAELRRKFLCLLSFSKKVRGSGGKPEPLTCVCCKGEGEMGDMYDYWVR